MFNLSLHNWRCFASQKFQIPSESFILIDENGSGKTSLLSAVYTLFCKKPWPGTKFADHLLSGSGYFGITTDYPDFSFTGQINPSGRLSTKYEKPGGEVSFNQILSKQNWPKILTYLPSDNYWLGQSRTSKLGILDNLLSQTSEDDFDAALSNLDKALKSKQRLLKHCQETETTADPILVQTLSQEILKSSVLVWQYRQKFWILLNQSLPEFCTWINSNLKDWILKWELTDVYGQRQKVEIEAIDFSQILNQDHDWAKLWHKETIVGKLLFGAQRDDFSIECNHLRVENVLSRGEMRLLVLFIKNLASSSILEKKEHQLWWFLDDIYNELDDTREEIMFSRIIQKANFSISTSTKKPDFESLVVCLEDLLSNN
jgi:recombinational DNA repair ATPase RecF